MKIVKLLILTILLLGCSDVPKSNTNTNTKPLEKEKNTTVTEKPQIEPQPVKQEEVKQEIVPAEKELTTEDWISRAEELKTIVHATSPSNLSEWGKNARTFRKKYQEYYSDSFKQNSETKVVISELIYSTQLMLSARAFNKPDDYKDALNRYDTKLKELKAFD